LTCLKDFIVYTVLNVLFVACVAVGFVIFNELVACLFPTFFVAKTVKFFASSNRLAQRIVRGDVPEPLLNRKVELCFLHLVVK